MPYSGAPTKLDYYQSDRLTQAVGMGDLWTDIGNIAKRVAGVAGAVSAASPYARQVASGESAIAIVPRGQTSVVTPIPGTSFAAGLPAWVVPVGIGALVLLLVTRRR